MITKSQYVRRLSQMLKTKEPCTTCPAFSKFTNYLDDSIHWTKRNIKSWCADDTRGALDSRICFTLCRPFVGLSNHMSGVLRGRCPCMCLGKDEALKRAHVAVDEYRAGTHPWKRGDKK